MSEPEQQSIDSLVKALHLQTESNNRLANSIAMLAGAIAEQMGEEPIDGPQYLDGSSAQ